jgi:hypothetical protein
MNLLSQTGRRALLNIFHRTYYYYYYSFIVFSSYSEGLGRTPSRHGGSDASASR